MSKVEEYFTAWNQAMKGDFSLVDQLYHIEIIYETSKFFSYQAYTRHTLENGESDYATSITVVHLKDGKIIQQKTVTQPLDFNPSEHLNWNWEDYEGQREAQFMSQKSGVQND